MTVRVRKALSAAAVFASMLFLAGPTTAIGTPQRAAFCHRSAMGRVSQLYSDVTTVTTKKTNADKSSRHLLIGVQPPRVAEFGRGRASAAQARFRRFERGVATLCVVLAAIGSAAHGPSRQARSAHHSNASRRRNMGCRH